MIAAGIGFSSKATVDSLRDAYNKAAARWVVTHLATAEDKADSVVFGAFAKSMALPVIRVDAAALTNAETQTQSGRSQSERGTGSVAEASAIVASGGRLVGPRSISIDRMATCAIAVGGRE